MTLMNDFYQRQSKRRSQGFTLFEVVLALLLSSILLAVVLRLLVAEWRGTAELKKRLEIQNALLTAGKTVSDAIRTAQKVEWVPNTKVLKVLPISAPLNSWDDYYVSDKDYNGIKDLYCEHLSTPNPIASRILNIDVQNLGQGLWKVVLQAGETGQTYDWEIVVRQRVDALP